MCLCALLDFHFAGHYSKSFSEAEAEAEAGPEGIFLFAYGRSASHSFIHSFTHSVTRSIAMTISFPGRCIVAAFLANVTLSSACRQAVLFIPVFHLPHVSEASTSPSAPAPAPAPAHSCPLYTHSKWRSSSSRLTALHFSFIFPRCFPLSIHSLDNHIKIQAQAEKKGFIFNLFAYSKLYRPTTN